LNWASIQNAAKEYDASFEATARRWVEKSNQECALIAFNPKNRLKKLPLELMYTITSDPFRKKYFERLLPGYEMGSDTHEYRYFFAETSEDETELQVNITPRGAVDFKMKLFSNTYRLFGLVTPLESEPPF
jgi:hypothetical protein